MNLFLFRPSLTLRNLWHGGAKYAPRAIWLQNKQNTVYSIVDCTYRANNRGSNAENSRRMVASITEVLYWMLLHLLDNRHTSCLTYQPCWKHLNQGKMAFNAWLHILHDKISLQLCMNASHSRLRVPICTHPHPEKHCIISWWIMLSPPSGPSATNHMHC